MTGPDVPSPGAPSAPEQTTGSGRPDRLGAGITHDTFWVFSSKITQKLINVCFIAVAARLLGAQGYGVFVLVSTMVLVATTLAGFGMRPMVVRMVSREVNRAEELLSNILVVRTVSAGLVYFLLMGFVYVADYSAGVRTLVWVGGIAVLFNCIQDALEAILVAFQRMKVMGLVVVLSSLTFAVAGILILWLDLGLIVLFAVNAAVTALFVLVTAGFIWRRLVRFRPRVDPVVIKAVLVGCLPFFVTVLLGFTDTKVDVVMLSLVEGPLEKNLAIGYYGPAHSILMAVMLLPRSLNLALVPVVSRKIYIEQEVVRSLVERSTKFVMIAISFPLILVTGLFSEQIVRLVFGPQFLPTATALTVLGWAYAFQALNLPSHSVLGSTREMRHFLPLLVCSFLLNIGLNFLLIPRYSFVGAAMGSVIVLSAGFLARFYFLGRIIGLRFSTARAYVRPFLVLALSLGAGHLLRPVLPWPLLALAVAAVYGSLLYLFRAVAPDEWEFVAATVGKRLRLRRSAA